MNGHSVIAHGIYPGKCHSSVDPEGRLRIQATCPQLFGVDGDPFWAEACVPPGWGSGLVTVQTNLGTYTGKLVQQVPNSGQTVWLMFIGGDTEYAVWLGVQK